MSGTFIEICPPRVYDFSALAASAGAMIMPVAERISVHSWTEGSLVVRVHTIDIADAGDSIEVQVSTDGFTQEDPTAIFTGSQVAVATLDSGVQAPFFSVTALTSPFAAMLRIDVAGVRGSAGVTALAAKLSIALSMKSA